MLPPFPPNSPPHLHQAAFNLAAKELEASNSPKKLGEIFRKSALLFDQETRINQRRQGGKPEDCKPGCSYCCNSMVLARITDVAGVVDHIKANFSGSQLESLKERIFHYERVVAPFFGEYRREIRAKCPFLENDRCSIYEARPTRCRGINSRNVADCEQIDADPEMQGERPSTPGQMDLLGALQVGISEALTRQGIYGGALDFARAVGIVLENPAALERSIQGGEEFTSAYLRSPQVNQTRYENAAPYYPSYGPGQEPVGFIVPADLAPAFEKYTEGDFKGAMALLTGSHPVNLLGKIAVPLLYKSEDEVLETREHVKRAIKELGEAKFDPREAFDALASMNTFGIAYQQYNDRDLLAELGQIIVHRITRAALPDLAQPVDRANRQGKIKVGYISANLTLSNGGSWARGWIKNHGPDIEKYVFFLGDSPDAVTQEFAKYADHFYHLKDNVVANARGIKSLGLDALIYTDIGMAGKNYQYASMRLAPVQCTAWGHPITSGLPTIDYYLSSDLMEPANGQDHYIEKLIRLPNSGLTYPRPKLPASKMFKSDFGLDDELLYLSCQNPMKYLPRWDYIYREICERTGRPIVFVEGALGMQKALLKERFAIAGINANWVPGLGRSDFLALTKLADVCLDTPGWNGGNTTLQALNEARPFVTLPGEFMRGRHSLAFAEIANAPGCIAKDPADFIAKACDPVRLQAALSDLNSDALFEDKKPVHALDEFFQSVCR